MSLDIQLAAPRLRELLGSLLNRDVVVSVIDGVQDPHALALYATGTGDTIGAVQCDCALTNFAGAALTMLPPTRVQESARTGEVGQEIFENASEVLNVLAQLFYEPRSAPVTLDSVTQSCAPRPNDALPTGLRKTPNHVAMRVEIPGYGAGTLGLTWV